jgi:hypothetical protein
MKIRIIPSKNNPTVAIPTPQEGTSTNRIVPTIPKKMQTAADSNTRICVAPLG